MESLLTSVDCSSVTVLLTVSTIVVTTEITEHITITLQ